jgi:hypothetical protein
MPKKERAGPRKDEQMQKQRLTFRLKLQNRSRKRRSDARFLGALKPRDQSQRRPLHVNSAPILAREVGERFEAYRINILLRSSGFHLGM